MATPGLGRPSREPGVRPSLVSPMGGGRAPQYPGQLEAARRSVHTSQARARPGAVSHRPGGTCWARAPGACGGTTHFCLQRCREADLPRFASPETARSLPSPRAAWTAVQAALLTKPIGVGDLEDPAYRRFTQPGEDKTRVPPQEGDVTVLGQVGSAQPLR